MKHTKNFFKKRLVFFFLILIFFSFVIASFNVSAHSPSSMMLSYNKNTKQLTVDVTHQVPDPNTHYVKNIVVKINGETNFSQDYTSQPGSSFSYIYEDIELAEGDIFAVTATCNVGGSITKELTVSSSDVSAAGGGSSTPGFEVILTIFAIIALLIIVRKNR